MKQALGYVVAFLAGVLTVWLMPIWATGGNWMISPVLRIIAVIAFVFAAIGVAPGGLAMVPLGLALWVGSTLVP